MCSSSFHDVTWVPPVDVATDMVSMSRGRGRTMCGNVPVYEPSAASAAPTLVCRCACFLLKSAFGVQASVFTDEG
jgi:hypothetical protein